MYKLGFVHLLFFIYNPFCFTFLKKPNLLLPLPYFLTLFCFGIAEDTLQQPNLHMKSTALNCFSSLACSKPIGTHPKISTGIAAMDWLELPAHKGTCCSSLYLQKKTPQPFSAPVQYVASTAKQDWSKAA